MWNASGMRLMVRMRMDGMRGGTRMTGATRMRGATMRGATRMRGGMMAIMGGRHCHVSGGDDAFRYEAMKPTSTKDDVRNSKGKPQSRVHFCGDEPVGQSPGLIHDSREACYSFPRSR